MATCQIQLKTEIKVLYIALTGNHTPYFSIYETSIAILDVPRCSLAKPVMLCNSQLKVC